SVEEAEGLILVHFEPSSVPPKPLEEARLPSWKAALEHAVEPPDPKPMEGARSTELIASENGYTGEKIALDFYETDVKNVFRIMREISGKNFAIDKDVVGTVTLSLEKPVPWDQVLDLVLKMNQLGIVNEGEIVRIATIATLQQEEESR